MPFNKVRIFFALVLLIPAFCSASGKLEDNFESLKRKEEKQDTSLIISSAEAHDSAFMFRQLDSILNTDKTLPSKDYFFLEKLYRISISLMRLYPEKTISHLTEKILVMQKEKKVYEQAILLRIISDCYNNSFKSPDKSISSAIQAYSLGKSLHDTLVIINSLCQVGRVYHWQQRYHEAIHFDSLAWTYAKDFSLSFAKVEPLQGLGYNYMMVNHFEKAIDYFEQAHLILKQTDDSIAIANAMVNLGLATSKAGNYFIADKYLKASLAYRNALHDNGGMGESLIALGDNAFAMKKYQAGINFYRQALKLLSTKADSGFILKAYDGLYLCYKKIDDNQSALEYFEKSHALKERIIQQTNQAKLEELNVKFNSEYKDQQIDLLHKNNMLQLQQAKQQRIIKNVFVGSFIAAIMIAVLFYSRYRIKQKSALSLMEKNIIIGHTLDELKQRQQQLIQSEKMASIGVLTAGVAHEINNPINFVSANISPLKRNFAELVDFITQKREESVNDLNYTIEETKKLLAGIEDGSKRTAEIVKGLRNFSRLDEEDMKKANINDGINSTLVLLQNKVKHQNIEVSKSLSTLPEIECYPGQLNQVFMNIITNAIDAIGENGKITITTSKENNQVKISIKDTGKGISEEVKQKIFDPFFTTKDVGKGTGLGLSISYGIIEKHNGKIEVESEIGKGSKFVITIPV